MRFFALDWERAFAFLEALGECSPALRRRLAQADLKALLESKSLGAELRALLAAGIVSATPDPLRVRLADGFHDTHKLLRALQHVPLLPRADEPSLERYVAEHFDEDERYSLGGKDHGYDGGLDGIVARLTSIAHTRTLLEARSCAAWEQALLERQAALGRGRAPEARLSQEAGHDLCLLLRHLIGGPGPLRLREFPGLFPELTGARLALAVELGLRYGVLFAALDTTAEVVLLLWPRVHARLRQGDPPPPAPTSTSESFLLAWALEDLEHLLVRADQALRMKADGYELFAADERELAEGLVVLPDWLATPELEALTAPRRVRAALDLAHAHELVTLHEEGRSTLLSPSAAGAAWLALPARARLAQLLEPVREFLVGSGPARQGSRAAHDFQPRSEDAGPIRNLSVACFSRLEPGQALEAKAFLRYHTASSSAQLGQRGGAHGYRALSEDELEDRLERKLRATLFEQLFPWGGARAGLSPRGELTLELTSVGRYLLGLAADFELEPHPAEARTPLRVQPDFELVFVAANPQLEARVARFAARRGRGVGVLFRITRDSIQAAARARLTAEEVLATLREASSAPLPVNVVHEIRGWFARCRHIELEPVQLLRCPDAESARRVLALAGPDVEAVSETVLALRDPKQKAELVRLCAKHGLFLQTRRGPGAH